MAVGCCSEVADITPAAMILDVVRKQRRATPAFKLLNKNQSIRLKRI